MAGILLVAALAKTYSGPGQSFVNDFGPASVAYVCFFMMLGFALVPQRGAIWPIAGILVVTTCLLEFMQLWHPPLLENLRATLAGRALLGTTFSWWDFPAYVTGGLAGVGILRWIARADNRPR